MSDGEYEEGGGLADDFLADLDGGAAYGCYHGTLLYIDMCPRAR